MSGINQQQMVMLREREESQIRDKLREVDELLTRECFFCGGILIDMIDNDIEFREEEQDDLDDADAEDTHHGGSAAGSYGARQSKQNLFDDKDEWAIE